MKFKTHNDGPVTRANLICLQGYIQATRTELEKVFGPADTSEPTDNMTTSWLVWFEDDTFVRIYDYRALTKPGMDDVHGWHIGTHGHHGVTLVHEAFREAHGLSCEQYGARG